MKIQIIMETEVEDEDMNPRSPLMRILKILAKDDTRMQWYVENRDRILAQEKEKRALYAREQYQKRKSKKNTQSVVNEVVNPAMIMPQDNVLRFDNL